AVSEGVAVPVIASGGGGSLGKLCGGLVGGRGRAGLAASIFHLGIHTTPQAQQYLPPRGVEGRGGAGRSTGPASASTGGAPRWCRRRTRAKCSWWPGWIGRPWRRRWRRG